MRLVTLVGLQLSHALVLIKRIGVRFEVLDKVGSSSEKVP